MPNYSHKYDEITLVCEDCENTQETLSDFNQYKLGDTNLACLICDGNIMITEIEHHIIPQHQKVECDNCKTQDIVHIGVLGSNKGWICPVCGPDEHGKSSYGVRLLEDIYYNSKQSTKINDLLLAQTSLDTFIKPCCE